MNFDALPVTRRVALVLATHLVAVSGGPAQTDPPTWVIGPVAAGWAYGALGPDMGFVAGGLLIAAAAVWARVMPGHEPTSAGSPLRGSAAE